MGREKKKTKGKKRKNERKKERKKKKEGKKRRKDKRRERESNETENKRFFSLPAYFFFFPFALFFSSQFTFSFSSSYLSTNLTGIINEKGKGNQNKSNITLSLFSCFFAREIDSKFIILISLVKK